MVNIIKDNLLPHVDDYDVILLGTNCYQVLRNGFQYELSRKYPHIKQLNNQTKYGDINKVGTILECGGTPSITLLYISFGYNFRGNNDEYLDYEGLNKTLKLCNLLYKGKKVATTLLGCTHYDGNGDKDKVLKVLSETMTNLQLDVYDYEQISHKEHKRKEFKELKSQKQKLFFNKEQSNDKKININNGPSQTN